MAKLQGKWEWMEEVNKPKLAIGVPGLKEDLIELGRLTKEKVLLLRQIRVQRQSIYYLVGDSSRLGFSSVLWGQGRMILEPGKFYPLYQGRS